MAASYYEVRPGDQFPGLFFDSCVSYLRDDKGLRGAMGLAADDAVGGGDNLFDEARMKLRDRSPFGARRYKKGKYADEELKQNDDSIEIIASQSY
eukprot:4189916-Pyramimonas_sp.AAC.1